MSNVAEIVAWHAFLTDFATAHPQFSDVVAHARAFWDELQRRLPGFRLPVTTPISEYVPIIHLAWRDNQGRYCEIEIGEDSNDWFWRDSRSKSTETGACLGHDLPPGFWSLLEAMACDQSGRLDAPCSPSTVPPDSADAVQARRPARIAQP